MPIPILVRTRAAITQPVGVSVGGGNGLYGGSSGATVYSRIGQPVTTAPQIRVAGYGGTTSGVMSRFTAPNVPSGGVNPQLTQSTAGLLPAQGELAVMARNNIVAALVAGSILVSARYIEQNPAPATPIPAPGPTPQNYYPPGMDYGGTSSTIAAQLTPPRLTGESLGSRTGRTPTTTGQGLGGGLPSYTNPRFQAGGGLNTSLTQADLPPGVYQGPGWYYRVQSTIYDYFQLPNKVKTGESESWGFLDPFSAVQSYQVASESLGISGLLYRRDYFKIAPNGANVGTFVAAAAEATAGELAGVDIFPIGAPAGSPQAGGGLGTSLGPTPPPDAAASVPQAPPQAPGLPLPGQTPTATGAVGSFSQLPGIPLPQAPNPTPRPAALPQVTPTPGPGPGTNAAAPDGSTVPNIQSSIGTTPALGTPPGLGSAPTPAQLVTSTPTPNGVIPIPGLEPPPILPPTDPPPPPPNRCNDPCVQGVADGVGSILDLISTLLGNVFGGMPPTETPPPGGALADTLGQIQDAIDGLTAGGGLGELAPAVADLGAKVDALAEQVQNVGETVGVDEFPATVPTTLISKQGQADTTKQLANLAQFLAWTVEQVDALFGQWEIPIEIEDTDLTKAGNQSQRIRLPNLAEATAEQMGLLLNLTTTVNALTEISMRTLTESGLAHKEAAIAHIYGRENAQYLAYEGKEVEVKIPFSFNPGAKTLEETLKNTEVKVRAWENVDQKDLKYYFNDFLSAAAIIRAVYWQKLDPEKDLTKQIIDLVKGADKFTKPSEDDNDDFDNFLDRVETGFTGATGITDSTHPYGRDTTRRPRIRKLGETKDPGGTIGGNISGT